MLSKRGLGGSWAGFWLDSEGFGRGLGRILGGFWEGLGRLWESFWIGFGFQKKKGSGTVWRSQPRKTFFPGRVAFGKLFAKSRFEKRSFFFAFAWKKIRLVPMASS